MANKLVRIAIHPSYFEKVFEPNRKKLELKLGIKLSQPKYTEYLAKNKTGIKFPKMKGLPKQFIIKRRK